MKSKWQNISYSENESCKILKKKWKSGFYDICYSALLYRCGEKISWFQVIKMF